MFGNIMIVVTVALFATKCQNKDDKTVVVTDTIVEEKVVPRNLSINKSNSYNDIFLDSGDIENFIRTENLNDTISKSIRDFYNVRNYEYAWFSSIGLIEQAFSFHSLYSSENETDLLNKFLENRLDMLRSGKRHPVNERDPSTIKTELQITVRFIQYGLKNYAKLGVSAAGLGTYIPARRRIIIDFADFVLATNSINTNYATLNESYKLLKIPLRLYEDIEKSGGWPLITTIQNNVKVGDSNQAFVLIKKRLQITGELSGHDTTQLFNVELENAIKIYQSNHGFKASGQVTRNLIKDMNISALARVQQLLINMQRMRWMPTEPDGLLIIVNIPEFELFVDSGKKVLFQMDVVVGAAGHHTSMFSGNLNQVVFSPYWNIPPSIVKKEIIPGIRRDENYLKKRNMEITGKEGGLPVVRQRPGELNALGKVKFLFPNSFNIYMHDTPEKGFFNRSERGLSHGCVRLGDAPKLAYFLLRNSKIWTPEKIDSAMNSGHEKFVKLNNPVPVIITYYTSWVDNQGILKFADDIYHHDSEMANKMFLNPQ